MTQANIGYGALVEMFDPDPLPGSWFQVGEVTNVSLPKLAMDVIDVTAINSPDGYKEFIPGMKDAGEVTLEMNFVPGGAADEFIRERFETRATIQTRITLPSPNSPSEQLTFNAFITGYEATVPATDKMAATVTLKVTGPVTYTGA